MLLLTLDELKETDIDFFISKTHYSLVERHGYHSHDFIEIVYVEKGEGVHLLGPDKIPCKAHDLFIVDVGEMHDFESDTDLSIMNCIFRPSFLDKDLLSMGKVTDCLNSYLLSTINLEKGQINSRIHLPRDINIRISELYNRMFYEYHTRRIGYADVIRGELLELIINIARTVESQQNISPKSNEHLIAEICQFIEQNSDKNIKIEQICNKIFFSRVHFSRLFKKVTGQTFKEFSNNLKMEKAIELLLTTDDSIQKISVDLGYSDVRHFYKTFKAHTGKSPIEYKTCVKKGVNVNHLA